MGLSFDEAKRLSAGTRLKVEKNDHIYEVVEVLVNGDGSRIHLVLKRDDGYETFAKDHEFDVMSVASKPDEPGSEDDQPPATDTDSTSGDETGEPSEGDQPAAEKRKGKK